MSFDPIHLWNQMTPIAQGVVVLLLIMGPDLHRHRDCPAMQPLRIRNSLKFRPMHARMNKGGVGSATPGISLPRAATGALLPADRQHVACGFRRPAPPPKPSQERAGMTLDEGFYSSVSW